MIETSRLLLTHLSYDDSEFVFELVNEPAFRQFIGDRGVNTKEDARDYLRKGAIDSYEKHGFGLYRVALKECTAPLGICGLVKRDGFEHPDLGFAFLQVNWLNGYAYESSQAVLEFARVRLGLPVVIALANADNERSLILLHKLGFVFEAIVRMPEESEDEPEDIHRYSIKLG